eukprot:15366460-Ditylum_brightwellii.AAC.2
MNQHVQTGIFLGYTATMQQIYYYDGILDHVKTASNINDYPVFTADDAINALYQASRNGESSSVGNNFISKLYEVIAMNASTPDHKFTRRKLEQRPDWMEWRKDEHVQLDEIHKCEMYGKPCYPTKGTVILNSVWTYMVKHYGGKKARSCCDGSVLP